VPPSSAAAADSKLVLVLVGAEPAFSAVDKQMRSHQHDIRRLKLDKALTYSKVCKAYKHAHNKAGDCVAVAEHKMGSELKSIAWQLLCC
jgi:hypothetical protein